MASSKQQISAAPLFNRLGREKGKAAKFAQDLQISRQVLANWRRRGVPAAQVPKIANLLGITTEVYYREAGLALNVLNQEPAQYTIEAAKLMDDFNALPGWLQDYVARLTEDLRRYTDALPAMVRDGMKSPPRDPEQYRQWEKNILDDMHKRLGNNV